jgi:hypothetical protein
LTRHPGVRFSASPEIVEQHLALPGSFAGRDASISGVHLASDAITFGG